MRNKIFTLLAFVTLATMMSCSSTKKITTTTAVPVAPPAIGKDAAPTADANTTKKNNDFSLPTYNPSERRLHDLIHEKVEVSFDWAKQRVIGKATLTLKPYFFSTDLLTLDAKNFDIKKVSFLNQKTPLKYEYNGLELNIELGKKFKRTEEYSIVIDYIAKPEERDSIGGSEAISSDKGLFFINPTGEEGSEKPHQIWTQGETQNNSRWMPTIDKPNERCTQEMYITVENKYKTLSNGLLVSSKSNADGTRTDYWKMDLPHAPYLFMMAVGDFAVVTDKWNGIDVNYYVEPAYEADARAIFPYTTEMLSFFSERLGVPYPWQKFSQVVVRDYVSGAMENTTAVIFGEFMQGHKRDLIDAETNELVVAHEMFHHWFGDYVTCESWSNLTLNEGFANYSEYLWLEHKHGKDDMERHRLTELGGYLGSTMQQPSHPLIHFGFKDREQMFDAHSYNKGGLILNYLRNYLGDDAFFTSLNRYLEKNKFTDVESHELRMAFEDTSGEDLNWFFNQWFYAAGHPVLDVNYSYDEAASMVTVNIEQKQDPDKNPPIYILPMAIDIHTAEGTSLRRSIRVTQRKESFTFQVPTKPLLVSVDADHVVPGVINYKKSEPEYVFQYYNGNGFTDRQESLEKIKSSKSEGAKKMYRDALNDPSWALRSSALDKADTKNDPTLWETISTMALKDAHSKVRSAAFKMLAKSGDAKFAATCKTTIDNPKEAYGVVSSALKTLAKLDPTAAAAYAKKLENEQNDAILTGISEIYLSKPDAAQQLPFFNKALAKMDGQEVVPFLENYVKVLKTADDATIMKSAAALRGIGISQAQSPYRRFGSVKALNDLRSFLKSRKSDDETQKAANAAHISEITKAIDEAKQKETVEQLKAVYKAQGF